ncbi:MAG: glutamine synthetase [Hoeflea sp.]|nr:glutamine synthetase [Hoeflea sp.]|tara:strand:- start:295 stop:1683 length:1389 start_codon:yes stop_codon:yes gene_type:complete
MLNESQTVAAESNAEAQVSPNAEAEKFLADHPDLESVDFLIADINGVLRGKWGPAEAISKVFKPGINLPLSIFGLDIWGREVEATGIHIETGDIDGYCRAIPGRVNRSPWSPRPAAQVLMSMYTEEGEPYPIDPRNALQGIVDRYTAKGLNPVVAFELEFYLVDPAAFRRSGRMGKDEGPGPEQQHMYSLSELRGQSDLFAEIRAAALAQNLPIDTIIKEAAPGQFEVNLKHRADPMAAADDTVLLRRVISECADNRGLKATFMAKPFLEWPGNGMHVHASVLDENGDNIFAGEEGDKRLQHAAAGLLSTLKDTLLFYIPSFNGYRRLQAGSYAPTRIAWGRNNRSVAVRVPASDEKARRLEHRMSGADANPYFVLAGVLGGMLEGIEAGKMPPPAVEGNAYNVPLPQLSDDMDDAIEDFERSDFIRRYFGAELRRIFGEIKRAELVAFDNEITPLERSTYL